MTADIGLRRRAVSELAATWEEKVGATSPDKGTKPASVGTVHVVAKAQAAAKTSHQGPAPVTSSARRCGAGLILTAVLSIVAAFTVGIFAGVVGTVTVMATHDYPWLDAQLGRLVVRLGHELSVQAGPRADSEQPAREQVTSCTSDQPLVERRTEVLDAETFARVQACLSDHPMTTENELNPEGFNGTRGFVIGFSALGVEQFLRETKFNCGDFNPLVPFFEAARHPETNGFVMNVLVCDKPTTKETLSVGEHVDDTLAHMKDGYDFIAHTVSVMYVSVPEDMEGGELELLGIHEEAHGPGRPSPAPVLESITPQHNLHAEFRGDSVHRVRGYATETNQLRISLVLEQYKVTEENEEFLVPYRLFQKNGMAMM